MGFLYIYRKRLNHTNSRILNEMKHSYPSVEYKPDADRVVNPDKLDQGKDKGKGDDVGAKP